MIWATLVVISLSNSDIRKGRVVLDKDQVTNLSDVEKDRVTLRAARTTLTPALPGCFIKLNKCMSCDLVQPQFYFAVETLNNKVMKKFIVFIVCSVAVICAFGCQKIEDEQPKLDDRLVGTKWQTSDFAHKVIYGGNPFEVYEFISTTEVECYTTSGGNVVRSNGTYSYTLAYPHITINAISTNGTVPTHYTFKDSRTMVRDGVDESTPYAKYIKQ